MNRVCIAQTQTRKHVLYTMSLSIENTESICLEISAVDIQAGSDDLSEIDVYFVLAGLCERVPGLHIS